MYNAILSIKEIVKRNDRTPLVTKQLIIEAINSMFPEPESLRDFTDGSKTKCENQ